MPYRPKRESLTRQEKINIKASRYLDRIIQITGALGGCWNLGSESCVRYDTAKYEFWIYPNRIERHDKRTGKMHHTCWRPPKQRMPYAEAVATVLLLLHDDPRNFETWWFQGRAQRLT